MLGWKSKWDIHTVLNKICAWHKAYLNEDDMNLYCLNEIKTYTQQ